MRVGPGDPRRLQDFLAAKLKLSRRAAKDLVDRRLVWVNRKCVWIAGYALNGGDEVETAKAVPKAPVKFHVRVLWSDVNYLVCDKPAGVLTCGDERSAEAILRAQESLPGLAAVHRLDRDTTGLLLITNDGTVIRTPVSSISVLGRNTQGVRLMRVAEDSKVVCVARAEAEPEEDETETVETASEE